MSREELFLYCVLKQPTEDGRKKGERAELILEPKHMLARNEQEVVMHATRELSEDIMEEADRLEVAVRPF